MFAESSSPRTLRRDEPQVASGYPGTYLLYMEFPEFLYGPGPRGRLWTAGILSLALLVTGCAGSRRTADAGPVSVPASPVTSERASEQASETKQPGTGGKQGVHHVVQPGQTLWRIAVVYGLTPEELARSNGIEDPTQVPAGRSLFIPGARSVLEVPPYPTPLGPGAESSPADVAGVTVAAGDWAWPVPSGEIISYFGAPRRRHRHGGVDIKGRQGAKIVASRGGTVEYSGSGMRGYGKTVIIDHGDSYSSLYAHNSKLLVKKGQRVRRGETIALVGRTGNASGPHCHFEIRRNDRTVDPLLYLIPPIEGR